MIYFPHTHLLEICYAVEAAQKSPFNNQVLCGSFDSDHREPTAVDYQKQKKCLKNDLKNYRDFSPYANFICANFITAIFQNFPKIFGLCILGLFISLMQFYTIELAKNLPNAILFAIYFSYCDHQVIICLMRFLANATFYRSQKSHQARTLCSYIIPFSFKKLWH